MDIAVPLEVVVGLAVLVAALYLVVVYLRRRTIARGRVITVCAFRGDDSAQWQLGMGRIGNDTAGRGRFEWFPLGGLSLRPRYVWPRESLDFSAPRDAQDAGDAVVEAIPGAQRVDCTSEGTAFQLVLPPTAYMAIRSWVEAVPPGQGLPTT